MTGFHPSAPPRRPPPPPRPDPVLPASLPFTTTTPTTRTLPTSTTVFNAVLDNNDTNNENDDNENTTDPTTENANEKDAAGAATDDRLELLSSSPQSNQQRIQQRLAEGTFNPLTYQYNNNNKSGDGSGLLALRALRMQALTTELLDTLERFDSDSKQQQQEQLKIQQQQLQSILVTHHEFLLAPLEDPTTVMVRSETSIGRSIEDSCRRRGTYRVCFYTTSMVDWGRSYSRDLEFIFSGITEHEE